MLLSVKNSSFGMVSSTVLRDPELSLGEKALYSYLSTYTDSSTKETFVSTLRMASECNIGVSTVKRHLQSLEKKGIIARIKRGHGMSSVTKLLK
jgi:DNA-binding MarR family transcriptional regulator